MKEIIKTSFTIKFRQNTKAELKCLQKGFTDITYERDGYIYVIENACNERGDTSSSGYFFSLGDAVDAIKTCSDWYRSKGTGKIYRYEPGAHKAGVLVWEN